MLWWVGAVLALVLSVVWIGFLSAEVVRGKWPAVSLGMIPGYAFHTVFGVLAVWLILKAVS